MASVNRARASTGVSVVTDGVPNRVLFVEKGTGLGVEWHGDEPSGACRGLQAGYTRGSLGTDILTTVARKVIAMSATAATSPVVDEILRANHGRKPKLLRLKYRRMAADSFAFFRGTAHLFAHAWSDLKPRDAGPHVLSCGDLHLENFGAYHAEDGRFLFDINDFDEAAVLPCAFDLARCTTSILLAAELWGLSPLTANRMTLTFLDHYRDAVQHASRTGTVGEIDTKTAKGPIKPLLGALVSGSQIELLDRQASRSKSGERSITRYPGKRPEVGRKKREEIVGAIEGYGESRGQSEAFKVIDVTGRVAGVGSLGVRRYLALVEGGGSPERNVLLDVKETAPSAVLACPSAKFPEGAGGEAERVVLAQSQLQACPASGLAAIEIGGRPFRLREMVPDENRSSLDLLKRRPGKLLRAVQIAGKLAAWSQVRGARHDGEGRQEELTSWAEGAAIDALLACSSRHAERTRRDYREFRRAYADGHLRPTAD